METDELIESLELRFRESVARESRNVSSNRALEKTDPQKCVEMLVMLSRGEGLTAIGKKYGVNRHTVADLRDRHFRTFEDVQDLALVAQMRQMRKVSDLNDRILDLMGGMGDEELLEVLKSHGTKEISNLSKAMQQGNYQIERMFDRLKAMREEEGREEGKVEVDFDRAYEAARKALGKG